MEPSPIDTDQKVPKIFNTLLRHLRPHVETEGIFRVCPQARALTALKTKVEVDRLDGVDAHALAALLKAWLRELPQGLVPPPFQVISYITDWHKWLDFIAIALIKGRLEG